MIHRIWELMGRKLAGEASPEELRELEGLLRAHPDQHFPAETITRLWEQARATSADAESAAAHVRHILRMQQKGIPIGQVTEDDHVAYLLEEHPKRKVYRYMWMAAAGLLLLTAAAWWLFLLPQENQHKVLAGRSAANEVSTRNGSRTRIQLPDGTHVWLNAGSKLSYDKNFGNGLREVTLTGEAFFDVEKDAEAPFIIHTAKIDVKVLGTTFNIKSYPNDRTTEATLIGGVIEASLRDRPDEKIRLRPSEKIVVINETSSFEHLPAGKTARQRAEAPILSVQRLTYYKPESDIIVETSWIDNKLVFREESFAELALQMERWYGVTIQFRNKAIKELRFTGIFESETIQQALNALKMTAAFNYNIQGNVVIIDQ